MPTLNSNNNFIERQQTHDPTSNVSINRAKNISAPQKVSLENVNSEKEIEDLRQTPHQLPMGVKNYGTPNNPNYTSTHPYSSNPPHDSNP